MAQSCVPRVIRNEMVATLLWNRWSRRFLRDPADPGSGTWLEKISASSANNCSRPKIVFRCRLCSWYFGITSASTSVVPHQETQRYIDGVVEGKAASFSGHERSTFHRAAALLFTGHDSAESTVGAPSVQEFESVLARIVSGTSPNDGMAGVGGGRKVRTIAHCLSEACKVPQQEFLENACSIALLRDARRSRLDIRFVAVDRRYNTMHGFVGRFRQRRGGAMNVAAATLKIITNFCVSKAGTSRAKLNRRLRIHIAERVHMITTDAAADEVLASEILREELSEHVKPKLKAVQFVLRDKAHASTRLLRRPFREDSDVDMVLHRLLRSSASPAQMIQHFVPSVIYAIYNHL